MKKLMTALIATAALAVPAAASAHDGWHHRHHGHALYARLTGTGTLAGATGTIASDTLGAGTFRAAVTATAAATTRTGTRGTLACSPATAALTLTGSSTSVASLTGKTCTWTPAGSTASTSMFWGRDTSVAGAGVVGSVAKAFLVRKPDGSIRGAVFAGVDRSLFTQFAVRQRDASHRTGDCDR
jgi:hypothetical protein